MMSEPTSGSFLGALIWKFGIFKVLGFGAALIGAAMMACFRPPQTKKEMFMQAAVALGCSFIFGGTAVSFVDSYFDFINLAEASWEEAVNTVVTVHGLVGAFSWGLFGGAAMIRDKFIADPMKTIKEIKDV